MNSSGSSVEELVARSTIQDFGDFRDLTPPLDPEADEEESRSIEDQARKDLEREGCPPCYPTNLEFPLRDIPEKYQGVISYWKSFPGTDDVVLRAQLSDWERFRQQSRLENWVEFQNYHIHIHERLEKEIDDLKRELNVSRKEGRHKNLLRWIEWERMTMDAVRPPSVEGEHDDQDGALITAQESSGFDRQMRRPKARGVLGQIRVSKTEPQKGSKQGRKRKTPKAAPAIQDAGPPQSSVSLNPDSLESKPRSTNKETGLRQMRPQRVSKVKRSADASSKLPPAVPLLQAGQKRALDRARPKYQRSPQRPQPAVVKTRSGRVPRRPEKWVPDTW
ncbi:hypothetical protein BDY21DRAFT_367029 [Lineolata rhizophorae]|uniref:Uncharacterized protein n=1 Tax=Lineolata rhizophorae TaxID=578093 RepID=A0A6A6NP48_9PEZI|nr:hypothetical protein BDY21DRAFT_367029 [Lineolata rhizophorae]